MQDIVDRRQYCQHQSQHLVFHIYPAILVFVVILNNIARRIHMDLTYEELLAENNALKECVKTQAKTINRLLNAYVLNIDEEESEELDNE